MLGLSESIRDLLEVGFEWRVLRYSLTDQKSVRLTSTVRK